MAGIPIFFFGVFTLWGGITGNLAAIYAALFGASNLLVQRPGSGVIIPPPFINTEPVGNAPQAASELPPGEVPQLSPSGTPELPSSTPAEIGPGTGLPQLGPGDLGQFLKDIEVG